MLTASRLWRSQGTAHSSPPPTAAVSQPWESALTGPCQKQISGLHRPLPNRRSIDISIGAARNFAHFPFTNRFTVPRSGTQGRPRNIYSLPTIYCQQEAVWAYPRPNQIFAGVPNRRGTVATAKGPGSARVGHNLPAQRALASDALVSGQKRTMAPLVAATFAEPESYAQQLEVKVS